MTVSGFSPILRASSITSTTSVQVPGKYAVARNDFDNLTNTDRELIYHATGQRIEPGFDPHQGTTSLFAAQIASDRSYGRLAPGQEVSASYLNGLSRQYEHAATGENPIAPFLTRALDYLASQGPRGVDVSA